MGTCCATHLVALIRVYLLNAQNNSVRVIHQKQIEENTNYFVRTITKLSYQTKHGLI